MDRERSEQFHEIFDRMIYLMTSPEIFKREDFVEVLHELCHFFDISKGITEFYKNLNDEKLGIGEVMKDYDDGREGEVVLTNRFVTPNFTIIKGSLYRPIGARPLDEDEMKKLSLCQKSMFSFIARNRLQTAVERLAFYDDNGYPNINSFSKRLEQINDNGKLYGNTVLMYNIRSMAIVNMDIGKEVGDLVIREYYNAFKNLFGENGLICRVGGDNFIMLFKNEYIERVLDIVKEYYIEYDAAHEKRIRISACAGVFQIPDDYKFISVGLIIGAVYPAVQEAKLEENGTIIFSDGKRTTAEKERVKRVRATFDEGLKQNEFKAYYQPKVDIYTGEIVGAEALCRWIHNGKFMSPAEFIPVLELNTDICRLDFRMLDLVCADLRKWKDAGKPLPRVSINLSRKHLLDPDLVNHLVQIIGEYDIPHKYIEFELTETTTDAGFANLRRVVEELRSQGFATSIDDFGMGYSSLNLIREVPWDVLKLDKDFLPASDDNDRDVTVLMYRHVASMAQDIGLECVTEGVETLKQVEILRKNKCRIAQGYFFSKPLPSEDFAERLGNNYLDLLNMN